MGLSRGTVEIHGWVYTIASGRIVAYDAAADRFVEPCRRDSRGDADSEWRDGSMRATKSRLAADALSSVVVFLVALPLCMGIAIASGVPPALGVITGVIGGIVVGFLGGFATSGERPGSRPYSHGHELIEKHGIEMLGPAVALAGVLQLIAGSVKIGRWFRAITPAVIFGMLAGIGILIFASQFHVMVDDKPRGSGLANLLSIPQSVLKGFTPNQGLAHNEAAFIGVATIATLVVGASTSRPSMRLVPGARWWPSFWRHSLPGCSGSRFSGWMYRRICLAPYRFRCWTAFRLYCRRNLSRPL